jgi:hypothetical protein
MNKCADIEKKFSAYLEGDVAQEELRLIEEHLTACRQCSRTLEELKKTKELVNNVEEIEPPPWLKHKIMAHVQEEAEKRKGIFRRLFFPLHIKIPVEVFATCLVVVMAFYVFKTTGPEIRSLQIPSEQGQIADYGQKQERKTAPIPATSKEKTVAEEIYKKEKTVPPQALKESTDAVVSGETLSSSAPPAPMPAAPSRSVPVRAAKEKEIEGKGAILQSAPSSAGMPESAYKKKGDIAASDTGAQYRLGGKSASNKAQLKAPAEKKQQTITMTVKADKATSAGSEIKDMLKSFGAADIKQISQESIEILTAVLPAQKLKELFEKLKTIGEVKENALIYNIPEEEITVRIEIVNTSKKP